MKYRAMKTFMGVGGVVHRRGDEVQLSGPADRQLLMRGLLAELSDDEAGPAKKKSPKPHAGGDKKPGHDEKDTRK